ncbi:MAG: twin-arginine translocation signal domain-containing protein [Actinomycetota bacterium]|nr:twin-arginine translocation signal domain-containing protein [Actinomycetota bacterium]
MAGALSLVAALAHFWAMPEHFEAWWGYGVFFLSAAVVQGLYGVVLLRRPGRTLLLLGLVGNLALVLLYTVTRTAGVPFFGPHAGEVEGMEVLGLSAVFAEAALVVALAVLLRPARRPGVVESARAGEPGQGFSRRDFLRTAGVAGALGISGGALGLRAAGVTGALGAAGVAAGVHAGSAHGQEMDAGGHEGDVGQHGGQGDVDLSRFDPSKFLRGSANRRVAYVSRAPPIGA